MLAVKFERPGTITGPGPIGRIVRIILGIILLYFFIETLTGYEGLVRVRSGWPDGTWWLGAIFGLYVLPGLVNIGFTQSWGRWPQVVFVFLVLAAVAFDLWQYGSFWGPPLGLLVFLLLTYFTGHLGLSFILAGIFAAPGWEMRAIPHVMGRMLGRKPAERYWPAGMTRLDRWEASWKRQE